MKKGKLFFILTILSIFLGGVYLFYVHDKTEALPSFISAHTTDKKYIIEKNNYSEDFADSVAKYLISNKKLSEKYSNRQEYIEQILDISEGGLYET